MGLSPLPAGLRFVVRLGLRAALVAGPLLLAGCSNRDADWPPAPRNAEEQAVVDSARRAVRQYDGWSDVAFVVQPRSDEWRVEAWKIVHPEAKGRNRCVPWAKRALRLDRNAVVVAYENHL